LIIFIQHDDRVREKTKKL